MSSSFLDRFDVHRPALTLMRGVDTWQWRRPRKDNVAQSSLGIKGISHNLDDEDSFAPGFIQRIGACCSSWSNMMRDFNPAIHFAMQTREKRSNDDNDDVRPFPETMPWITGGLCEVTWSPFQMYCDTDHTHELLSVPQFLRLFARVKLPQITSMTSMWHRLPMTSNSRLTLY